AHCYQRWDRLHRYIAQGTVQDQLDNHISRFFRSLCLLQGEAYPVSLCLQYIFLNHVVFPPLGSIPVFFDWRHICTFTDAEHIRASAASVWGSQNVMSMARYSSIAVLSAARAWARWPAVAYSGPRPWWLWAWSGHMPSSSAWARACR